MRIALRDFSATCDAIVSRRLAEELYYTIVSGNSDVNILDLMRTLGVEFEFCHSAFDYRPTLPYFVVVLLIVHAVGILHPRRGSHGWPV